MTSLSSHYIAVDPDGTYRAVEPTYAGICDGMHDATFTIIELPGDDGDSHSLFVDDEGMLNGSRLNVPASIFVRRALYGSVVLTGGADDEGETLRPTRSAASALMALAHVWNAVEQSAATLGQSLAVVADANLIPPPVVIGLSEDEFMRYLSEGR